LRELLNISQRRKGLAGVVEYLAKTQRRKEKTALRLCVAYINPASHSSPYPFAALRDIF
jgi:hypothetical protein